MRKMPEQEKQRISVVRGQQVVPLIADGRCPPERKVQLWRGIMLERHSVTAMEIPEHEHRDFCLHLQLAGSGDMEWWSEGGNRTEDTSPGSMILLAPGTRDRLRWTERSERLILSFQPERFQRIAEQLGVDATAVEFANRWSLRDGALRNLMQAMSLEASNGFLLGQAYADLLGLQLGRHLLQQYAATPIRLPEMRGGLPLPRLRRVLEFMTENSGSDIGLAAIANEAGLSPYHFAREFTAALRLSPHQYLLDQRIRVAKTLLRSTALPVQEVALQSGWGSAVNFVRAFRLRVGVTPGEWRKSE